MIHTTIRVVTLAFLCLIFITPTAFGDKPSPIVRELPGISPRPFIPDDAPVAFRTSDTCYVNNGGELTYYVYPWVIGDELYKAYQDPELNCDNPYPFTVQEVYLALYVLSAATIQLAVDVEMADLTDPTCPVPGAMLAITSLYEISLDADLYIITIPLDSPVVVNAPYFVGVYFGPDGNPEYTAVVTDDTPVGCVSYNDWGEGYIDLDTVHNVDTGEKTFPGRLSIFSTGFPGSGAVPPSPAARFISPQHLQLVGPSVELWVNDDAGSNIIAQALFQYNANSAWYTIGADNIDDPILRDGVNPSGTGNGLAYTWSTAGLSENNYQVRSIIIDTLGRADTAKITLHVDPTPPFPEFQQPTFEQNVCEGITASVNCPDEDLSFFSFETKAAHLNFMLPIAAISQNLGGDVDGDPTDGNFASQGEYGDYCSGPAAAAMAITYWNSLGYSALLNEGITALSATQLMSRLTESMKIVENQGTYDEEFISGLRDYLLTHGDQFTVRIDKNPTVSLLRTWMEDYEYSVMVGLSGSPGVWMTACGASGLGDAGQYTFRLADPVTGAINDYTVAENGGVMSILYDGIWHDIDIMVGMAPMQWNVVRTPVGFDSDGSNGWSFYWDVSGLTEDSLYFLHTTANDNAGYSGSASVMVVNSCSVAYIAGDVNGDELVNMADLIYLTNRLYKDGPMPPAGYDVMDINCDMVVNLADVIYLYRYLLLAGPAPVSCP